MPTPLDRPATPDGLFLWVMHRFAEVFADHAVLKGGMALRLIDSPRSTTDIDYVFVPFESKREVLEQIESVLAELPDARVETRMHSTTMRSTIRVDGAAIQLEVNVARECDAIPMATGGFARSLGQPSRIVRIMSPEHALAHKLAAWNERRLLRDLFDCYFLWSRVGASPDRAVLEERLGSIQSRIPRLRKRRQMSRSELAGELQQAVGTLAETQLEDELGSILPPEELAGLVPRLMASIRGLAERLGER